MALESRLRFTRPRQEGSPETADRKSRGSKRSLGFSENGHPAPDVGTLEVLAEALGAPLEELSNGGEQASSFPNLPNRLSCDDIVGLKRRK